MSSQKKSRVGIIVSKSVVIAGLVALSFGVSLWKIQLPANAKPLCEKLGLCPRTPPKSERVGDNFRVRNRWNPNCLASIGDSKSIDNRVGMGTCDSSNSIWRWENHQLRNAWNPYCLGSIGNSKAVDNPVVMGACGQSNAVWKGDNQRQFRNGWNPYCLGSIGNSKAVDNPVVMGGCGQSNAEWYIENVQ